jgi:tetratricopeptide (TPR) repeat protein
MKDRPTANRDFLGDLSIWLLLALTIFAVYAQVADFEFVNYDDQIYVYQNSNVQAGLTPDSARWALTAVVSNNWSPVTMFSHLAVAQLFEMRSGMHHLVNVLFHFLGAGFLYLALARATGARGASAFVAFVFALHPLNTGTVAWVSERKDVLCGFFWFLALYVYVRYSEQPSRTRYYLAVAVPFCLGLLSKPMLVSFPLTLLLFDFWPLRRTLSPRIFWEKLPLFTLSAIVATTTYLAQSSTGAVQSLPLAGRIANAILSYFFYIRQMFWPIGLAVLYPYPTSLATWKVAAALAALLGITALTILARRTLPYLMVGWLWFLVTLIPVIGFVQVGTQAHADRYMYVPMVGLLMIVAWTAADMAAKWPRLQPAVVVAAVVIVCVLMFITRSETSYWQNSGTLYQRAIQVTKDNAVAENNLGVYHASLASYSDAIPHYQAALRIKPDYAAAENNLGRSLRELEGCEPAIPHFEAAARLESGYAPPLYNLGLCSTMGGNYPAAIPYFEAAIRADPKYIDALLGRAVSLSKIPGHTDDAIRAFDAAVAAGPNAAGVRSAYGQVLVSLGRKKEAIVQLEIAEQLHPSLETSGLLNTLR